MTQHPDDAAPPPSGRPPPEAAFLALFKRLEREIVGFLINRVGRQAAEDLAQEVWRKVWQEFQKGIPHGNLRAWVFAIARHAVTDDYRKAKSPPEHADLETVASNGPAPFAHLVEQERAAALAECLEQLPLPMRQVVQAILQGGEYSAVAESLGISSQQAYKSTFTAKQRLAECVQHKLG